MITLDMKPLYDFSILDHELSLFSSHNNDRSTFLVLIDNTQKKIYQFSVDKLNAKITELVQFVAIRDCPNVVELQSNQNSLFLKKQSIDM